MSLTNWFVVGAPELSDVIAWRDQAVFDLEDLDASPEKVSQLQAEREKLFGEALKAARAVSKRRAAAAKELAAKVTAELESSCHERIETRDPCIGT